MGKIGENMGVRSVCQHTRKYRGRKKKMKKLKKNKNKKSGKKKIKNSTLHVDKGRVDESCMGASKSCAEVAQKKRGNRARS